MKFFLQTQVRQKCFFLQKYSTYDFILNSGQYQDYSGLRNKYLNNKICEFEATDSRYLGQGSDLQHFQKNAYNSKTIRLLLKKKY